MTFLVSVGFTTGAGVDASYLRLNDPVAGRLDTALLAPAGLTTDLSTDANGFQRVMEFAIDRSSTQNSQTLFEYAAGTLSLTLRDDNGDLDPANIAEPIPGVSITLAKVWNGMTYPLFTGTVDSWLPSLVGPDQAVVKITASDALSQLSGYVFNEGAAVGAGELSGARIARLLDEVGWPTGRRDLDPGTATLGAVTMTGSALDLLRTTATAEVGDLWATADGLIRFRDRYRLYTDTSSSTVQAVFGRDMAGGELPYISLGMSYDDSGLINVVRASRDGGTVYESRDDTSRFRYGEKAIEQLSLVLNDDFQVSAWADYVRARGSVPQLRFTNVVIDPRVDESTYYPQVLTRDFGDRIRIVRRPPGVTADSREQYIRGIHHAFSAPNTWQTTWELEAAVSGAPMLLDDAILGLLDHNVLIY